jgi:integrating conjugative element protein (TIGR03759 family)
MKHIVAIVSLLFSLRVAADTSETTASRTQITQVQQTTLNIHENTPQYWDLTELDWARYKTIMQGPQGRWTPDEDPPFILGIHAKNNTERRRFAEIQVMVEVRRAKREIAFDNAYTAAFSRLFPNMDVIDYQKIQAARLKSSLLTDNTQPSFLDDNFRPGDRLVLFVEKGCANCVKLYSRAMSVIQNESNLLLDIRFIAHTREEIQTWAETAAIPQKIYQAGTISLNLASSDILTTLRTQHDNQDAKFFRLRGNEYATLAN